MTITPDQAQALLDGDLAPGPYYVEEDDLDGDIFGNAAGHEMTFAPQLRMKIEWKEGGETALFAAAPDLAQTIAGMTEQWKAEYREIWGAWLAVSDWTTEDKARLALTQDQFKDATTRLVRRLVGPVEVTE